ncbi:hypothetical protein [Pseudoduganella namucuonensis]|uniref:Uncharacterized protein n=1 Tax=Pseudoduganella namucuonensis TaxID=1035707 RepID=A0A1I7LJ18_9BURK|nr:hypothetical protein [Pseudoduganella namucuonensis]SFV09674.1 hypothetical protein SAMN05216552_103060 [Pseudoduganella namucuonensis]
MAKVHNPANSAVEEQAVQVESIVEGLQSQLWAGGFNLDDFIDAANTACLARGKPPFDFNPRVA